MIIKFKIFNEAISPEDFQKNVELNIEIDSKNDVGSKDLLKQKDFKITDIQNRINYLDNQKKQINQEIINLQNAQRDLAPNNPNDPNNANNLKNFTSQQQQKIKIQQDKLNVLIREINDLKSEIDRNQQKYKI